MWVSVWGGVSSHAFKLGRKVKVQAGIGVFSGSCVDGSTGKPRQISQWVYREWIIERINSAINILH